MRVLNAILVREFYLANSGFFLLVVAIAGGFMRSYEHIALAEFFISTPMVLCIPLTVWILYALKVANFNGERLSLQENEFVFYFPLFPGTKQWSMVLRIAALQLSPFFLYALFLCLVALKHGMWTSPALIAMACALLLWLTSLRLLFELRHPNQEKKISFFSRLLNASFTKPFPLFFTEWMIRHDLAMLTGTKIFSVLVLIGIIELYKTDTYDLRLISLGIIISASANASLVQALHHFENFHLSWLRGLPLSFLRRMALTLMTLLLIILPEGIVLIRNFPEGLDWQQCLASLVFFVSIPTMFYGWLFTKNRNQQEIMPMVFCLVMVWFLAVLFKQPTVLITAVNISAGLFLWKKYYYSFEYVSKE